MGLDSAIPIHMSPNPIAAFPGFGWHNNTRPKRPEGYWKWNVVPGGMHTAELNIRRVRKWLRDAQDAPIELEDLSDGM